jgi:hypothetical protein
MVTDSLPIYISLGAGVQSSTMALMSAKGEVPGSDRVKGCIFADTQDEPQSVYTWLDWLEKQLPWPVHRVTAGRLSDMALTMRVTKDGRRYSRSDIPVYALSSNGSIGKVMNRSCTVDFKIRPILKKLRQLAKVKRGTKHWVAIQWIGISLDEMQRMKPSRDPWAKCEWPLVAARMTRRHCLDWMEKNNYPKPPRSSCVFCPYHRDSEWRRLQVDEPESFAAAVAFEKSLQEAKGISENFHSKPFLHKSCKPLETIDFRSDVERGQNLLFDDSWNDECEGMCGV